MNKTTNFVNYLNLAEVAIGFKSISTDPAYKPEIEKTVVWFKNLFDQNGFRVSVWSTKTSNPVILASYALNPKAETVMVYGHYDVQPATKEDGWKSDPFRLHNDGKRLYGRGVIDNKGQVLIHISTIIDLIKTGKLKYNVKFLLEGNEETSNPDLAGLMKLHKTDLACDLFMISDGELTNNKPTIEVSLRGGFNCTLVYQTGKNNLHSGIYGGAVPNAAHELVKFLSGLHDQHGQVTYPEFYVDADTISNQELVNNRNLDSNETTTAKLAGVARLLKKPNTDFYTQTGLIPTIQITGIKTGYIGEGYANIVTAIAEARLNFRIVTSQNPEKVFADFEKYVKNLTPKYVSYQLIIHGEHKPIKINTNSPNMIEAEKILARVYKTKPVKKYVGGALPIVAEVKEILGVDSLLIPLVNEDCNMHGANENFDLKFVHKALEFSREFFSTA